MRYLPLSDQDRADMLARIGINSIDDLFVDIPPEARLAAPMDLPRRKSELEVERHLSRLAAKNVPASSVPFFIGGGAYKHHVPASVDHLIQRSEFLTSYTPYQPEITQGTLQALFEFQTQIANLTAMDVANASMYDGSTAAAEAVLMAHRVTKRNKAVISGGLHPHYRAVIRTTSELADDTFDILPADPTGTEDILSRIDNETLLRRRAVAVLLRPAHRPEADRGKGARMRRAAGRGLHRGRLARPDRAGGHARRRHRGGRGPVARQSADLRRALCRPLRHQAEIHPPDCRAGFAARRSMPTASAASC